MSLGLILRKAYRLFKNGSFHTKDYLTYRKFLKENKHQYKKSYFNLTIDFELAWSRARRGDGVTTREESLRRSRQTREMVPVLLKLCEQYKVPVTFATVAHVALSDCSGHDKPPAFAPFWVKDDWYKIDPLSNLSSDKDYYGADLIRMIKDSAISHEIASHGFSHVDLSDSETTEDIAIYEIRQSAEILKRDNPELSTFVFPNNHVAYLDDVKKCGFTSYRVKKNQEIRKDSLGLYQFPLGIWLSPLAFLPEEMLSLIDIGTKRNQLINGYCHLFEFDSKSQCQFFFEPIFKRIESLRKTGIIEALTVRDIIRKVHESR